MKQFKNKEEFNAYIWKNQVKKQPETLEDMLFFDKNNDRTVEEIIELLEKDGYNLNNLIENGHYYEIGEYTNNGWLYEDELYGIENWKNEIRKRPLRENFLEA